MPGAGTLDTSTSSWRSWRAATLHPSSGQCPDGALGALFGGQVRRRLGFGAIADISGLNGVMAKSAVGLAAAAALCLLARLTCDSSDS